jgi:predicted NAD/FAD-binding protein
MTNIAIIGGGVGGLAVAYNVMQNWINAGKPQPQPTVTVYEASNRFGGNGDTAHFTLGNLPNTNPAQPFNRWADLGVNDFNATAYTNIVAVMNTIGYTQGADYTFLEDSTSYYTLDGSIAWTTGTTLVDAPLTDMPQALQAAVDAFMNQAAKDATNPTYANYTVEQYITEVFSQNTAYDPRLGPQVIYPRVNGMYFTDEIDSAGLPLRAVMHYYAIQEGAGGNPAQRMYFIGGASTWIAALTNYMQQTLGINLVSNSPMSLTGGNGGWMVTNTVSGAAESADVVVIATHADDALKLIANGVPAGVLSVLGMIKYQDGLCVAHTFSGILPPDVNAWKTYNILIHDVATYLTPYTITYVCNRHQNDYANQTYNYFGGPQFFISVNPPVPIPNQYVLQDMNTGLPAVANLRHNVFNFDCLNAQSAINSWQGENGLYFAGGWTNGAGLHEECWIQGQNIATMILNPGARPTDHLYDESRGPDQYAPAYIRNLLRPG